MFASAYGLARLQNCRLHVDDAILGELSDSFQMKLIDERMWLSYEGYTKTGNIEIISNICTFLHELIRPNAFKNIELEGYWQSYLYFDAYREEIREIFTGRNNSLIRIAAYFTNITKHICPLCPPLPNTNQTELREAFRTRYNITWIGIHIRRGDFYSIGFASDERYIRRAMVYFQRRYYYQRVRFIVGSDDKSYCDELFVRQKRLKKVFILPYRFLPSDDLVALSLCHHSIVTGGTYSFWVAYLAGGEVIHDVKYQAVCSRADYYPPWFVLVGPTIEKKV
jgi:galactoside 2-L-fucosyltransferase 1/2